MELIDVLKNKKIKVTEIPKWGAYLRQQWESNFTNHISHEEKKSIYLYEDRIACGYLWHLFSWEKRDYIKAEEAEKEFNNERKNICYIFYQHSDFALILENVSGFIANDLSKEEDIYVVDKEFNWTYVKTHEIECGPYFSRKMESSKL